MKPPGKRALEKARKEQERKEYARLVLETYRRFAQDDRRKVVDLKTSVQLKARHQL